MLDIVGGVGAIEDQLVQGLLKFARELGPVSAHRLQPLIYDFPIALVIVDQPGVTFFAALIGAACGRHEELVKMGFVFHLEAGLDSVLLLQVVFPILIDLRHQVITDRRRGLIVEAAIERDKHRIGIAVYYLVALGLDQLDRLNDDVVSAFGNRTGQTRIMQPAALGTEHTVKRIHDDLDRLRQRGVGIALGLVACRPQSSR